MASPSEDVKRQEYDRLFDEIDEFTETGGDIDSPEYQAKAKRMLELQAELGLGDEIGDADEF